MAKTVDEFVEEKVLPQFRDVVGQLRALMAECAPNAKEMMSHGLPMWIDRSTLAWISPTKKDITFSFAFGAEFEDPYGLLKGDGKNARFVKIRDVGSVDPEVLRSYIAQAVERDTRW
ncbi:MAG TPA: DUF1801 domain-containing protein [Actinomycetota bacterium]|nr:DUF1801 domain-containing protein [Actinomycetota bacterium]